MMALAPALGLLKKVPLSWWAMGAVLAAVSTWGGCVMVQRDLARAATATAQAELKVCRAQNEVLVGAVNRQNMAVAEVERLGKELRADTGRTLAAVRRQNQASAAAVAAIEQKIQAPAPVRADGTVADCTDAWREIEARARE